MKLLINRICMAALSGGIAFSPLAPCSAAQTVSVFARLGGTSDGSHAKSPPAQGPDGNLYGTTEAGGPANCGTIYRLVPGGAVTTIYTFTDHGDGSNPTAALTLGPDGNLYGTTPRVAVSNSQGTVFRVTPAGVLTTIHSFSALDSNASNADGADPEAALLLGADGNLYGTTAAGGAGGGGTVFRITPTGVFTSLHSFTSTNAGDPYGPLTALAQGTDGNFYGTARGGNVQGATINKGVVFRMTPEGVVTLIYTFTGTNDGAYPGTLIRGTDGNFYGLTGSGGGFATGTGLAADGTAFQLTPIGVLTTLFRFGANGGVIGGSATQPPPALTQGTDGDFYGTSSVDGAKDGDIFQLTSAGAVTVLHSFPIVPVSGKGFYYVVSLPEGAGPFGVTQGTDGNFYGATATGAGGPTLEVSPTGPGTIYQLTPSGTLTAYSHFLLGGNGGKGTLRQAADGSFYGVTSAGGALDDGTIFGVAASGVTSALAHSFNESAPTGGLLPGGDGTFYGTTTGGDIYSLKADGTFTTLFTFSDFPTDPDAVNGVEPNADLVASADGTMLYGTTQVGGAGGAGTVFSFNLATGEEKVLHSFLPPNQSLDSNFPLTGLTANADGTLLYGTTKTGGVTTAGTVYSINPVTGDYRLLHAFAGGSEGIFPLAPLALASDGSFYGTTSTNAFPAVQDDSDFPPLSAVFRIGTDGVLTAVHGFAKNRTEGTGSAYPLLQASDGNFYGVTATVTGDDGNPVGPFLFSMTPAGTLTILGGASGPVTGFNGALIQAADGNLYGVTNRGGTDNNGVIYRLAPLPAPVVNSAITAAGQVGTAFSYQITADNIPTGFGATGLPDGLHVDTTSGLISGAPTVSGTFTVTLSAVNSTGSGTAMLTLTIAPLTVTLTATVPEIVVNHGQTGQFLLTLSNASTKDLYVIYAIRGSALPGVDYVSLKGTAKIKAGKTTKIIKVLPEGDLGGASKKTVVLMLAPGEGYAVGTMGKVKVKIYSSEQ